MEPTRQWTLQPEDLPEPLSRWTERLLQWAASFPQMAYYGPNQLPYPHGGFRHLLAISTAPATASPEEALLTHLQQGLHRHAGQLLCVLLGYDLKNEIENLSSRHPDHVGFPRLHYFAPEIYFLLDGPTITVCSSTRSLPEILAAVATTPLSPLPVPNTDLKIKQRVSKEAYAHVVQAIRKDIEEGEVYELNYCLEFFAEQVQLNPVSAFLALNRASPMPFAGMFKVEDRFLLCASPERFLKKDEDLLISQPIKGTIRRGNSPEEDTLLQHQLRNDEKEQAENMMIVDLVRNDLRRSCATGSVRVEELFGIYPFRHVSQMISTVTGQLRPECDLIDVLRGAFPMGSMTGAPKIRAMELIEEYEVNRRGLFSGSIGYVLPNGDADFNVVIRSLQYNARSGYLSFLVGSAITYDSDPEREYAECLLKARAILEVLGKGE